MITHGELQEIETIMCYLTENFGPGATDLAVEVTLFDSNGEDVGVVKLDGVVYNFFPAQEPSPIRAIR